MPVKKKKKKTVVPQDSDHSSDKLLSEARDVRQASQLEKVMPPLLMDRTMTENHTHTHQT